MSGLLWSPRKEKEVLGQELRTFTRECLHEEIMSMGSHIEHTVCSHVTKLFRNRYSGTDTGETDMAPAFSLGPMPSVGGQQTGPDMGSHQLSAFFKGGMTLQSSRTSQGTRKNKSRQSMQSMNRRTSLSLEDESTSWMFRHRKSHIPADLKRKLYFGRDSMTSVGSGSGETRIGSAETRMTNLSSMQTMTEPRSREDGYVSLSTYGDSPAMTKTASLHSEHPLHSERRDRERFVSEFGERGSNMTMTSGKGSTVYSASFQEKGSTMYSASNPSAALSAIYQGIVEDETDRTSGEGDGGFESREGTLMVESEDGSGDARRVQVDKKSLNFVIDNSDDDEGNAGVIRRETEPWRRRMTTRLPEELFSIPEPRSSLVYASFSWWVMDIRFTYTVGLFIMLNALSMGAETDYMARHWTEEMPLAFLACDVGFCVVFTVELLLRLTVYGKQFFSMTGWQWNIFDVSMVIFQVMEAICGVVARMHGSPGFGSRAMASSKVGILRMMRVFRLFRVLRLVRLMSVFSELRMFIVSVADSMRSLFWTVMLILLAMYIGGVYLTQLVTDHKILIPGDSERVVSSEEFQVLHKYYGSLDRSMLTLYETISEGIPWSEVMEPLSRYCSPWMGLVFSLWMAFTIFAMLNVITGIFVESALHTANDDKKKLLMYQMSQWFAEADVDNTGTVTWDEFRLHLANPKMERFLKIVDLDTQEAWDLFHLLDIHRNGEIPVDDFVNGCVRVTGTAKAIDLVTLMHQYRVTSDRLNEHCIFTEEMMGRLEALLMILCNGRASGSGTLEVDSNAGNEAVRCIENRNLLRGNSLRDSLSGTRSALNQRIQ